MKHGKFSILFAFALIFWCSFRLAAQSSVCDLKIETQLFESGELVKDTRATAENVGTSKIYKSVDKDGMPYFKSLAEGEYKFTVTGKGYKQSVMTFFHKCKLEKNNFAESLFFMWKGNSNEIAKSPLPKTGIIVSKATAGSSGFFKAADGPIQAVGTLDKNGYLGRGVVNGSAQNLVKPKYPLTAKYVKVSGAVNVRVLIDEKGNVIEAEALSGHPLLHLESIKAALESKFLPTTLQGKPVKVNGVIVYNFVP